MTYAELLRAIQQDIRNDDSARLRVWGTWEQETKKKALKAKRYPFVSHYTWVAPASKNIYHLFAFVPKHSFWDKPEYFILTEYEGKQGKVFVHLFCNGIDPQNSTNYVSLDIYEPHFISRFYERHFGGVRQFNIRDWITFIIRNNWHMPMTDFLSLASEKEKEKFDSVFTNESRVSIDGVSMCKRSWDDDRIIVYKTFIPYGRLFDEQMPFAVMAGIHLYCRLAENYNPQCKKEIKAIYDKARQYYVSANFAKMIGYNYPTSTIFLLYTAEAIRDLSKYISMPDYPAQQTDASA